MLQLRRLLLLQLPIILLFTFAFVITNRGDEGKLETDVLRRSVYPALRRLEGMYTDLKFRTRGPRPVRQKIVIVEVDDRAVTQLQRWPWHRDAVAFLVMQALDAGAKVVGLDIVFPEPDQRVSDPTAELLTQLGQADAIPQFETDLFLQRVIAVSKDKLVLGWMTDYDCRPGYHDRTCAIGEVSEVLPPKFAYQMFSKPERFDAATTRLPSVPSITGNLPGYHEAADHAGFLVTAVDETDDITRRAQLMMLVDGRPHPSLPLEMARIGLSEELRLALDSNFDVARLGFAHSGLDIPVDASGAMAINFRGPGYHFPFVGAIDLLDDKELIPVIQNGLITMQSRKGVFENAYVLIGVTAMGAHDLRHFPFGNNIPGTEGLATILDNVLTGDPIERTPDPVWWLVLGLMTVGAFGFGLLMIRLPALPAMLTSLALIAALVAGDMYVLFAGHDIDANSVFLILELAALFIATVALKYVFEERGKQFIRGAFSKYLAPSVVDQMLKDPSKLALGGETRRLTIMMSDLRGFTAMAERMKPAEVLTVLNHYLGTMADIIVEHDGTIDEFIGDAILVIFGAPIEGKDDARRAVACAIAMQRAMTGINEHNARLGLPKLEMGIALNTGEVIVGNIGSQKHIKYGVVGSHVNLTARIESNTVGGQVLISGSTYELAGDDVKVGGKQMIVAKGFPEPIPAYDLKAIGAPYNLALEEIELGLQKLAEPLAVRYRVMKGKNEEGEAHDATFTSLSKLGATMTGGGSLEALQNLKVQVLGADGAAIEGDLYAKVTEAGEHTTLRFTAVPPAVEAAITARVAKTSP